MLRELIYVDTDKVRSLLAQLDGGIPEDSKITDRKQGTLSGGIRNIASREQVWGSEESTQRSLADAVFPTLEDALTTEGYLTDVSEVTSRITATSLTEFKSKYPPGSFLRITAPARLFDARYVAKAFAGYAIAGEGAVGMTAQNQPAAPPSRSSTGPKKAGRTPQPRSTIKPQGDRQVELEDLIPDRVSELPGGISLDQLRAFIKVARGVFYPGLHIAMTPGGADGVSVTARLQEDRRFLDSEPEILFARYGLQEQEWTMVGTVGSYSPDPNFSYTPTSITHGTTSVSRAKILQSINDLLVVLGMTGLADQPQHPGLSIVPFAVYRPILPATGTDLLPH